MGFWIGWLCGIGTAVAHLLLWRWLLSGGRADKPRRKTRKGYARNWEETRNFLCYDGTVMPVSRQTKEERYGKNK